MSLKLIKFGGTSLQDAKSIKQCVSIVERERSKCIVVVSAISKFTSQLILLIEYAKKQKPKLINSLLSSIEDRHKNILIDLSNSKEANDLWDLEFLSKFEKLRAILYGASLVGDITQKTEAKIISFGEKFSSLLFKIALEKNNLKTKRIESEGIIKTNSDYLEAIVDFKSTKKFSKKILCPLLEKNIIPVVTGYIAKDTHGDITLLGRGGSDYSAAIIGIVLNADAVEIWTDVDGIMSSDPRHVKNAISWDELGIDIISELAYSGAKVVHPKSIAVAVKNNIPIFVFNTFNLNFKGTRVILEKTSGIKGIVTRKDNTLINIENPNMLEDVGFIAKITKIISDHNIALDICATAETSFTFSIEEKDYSPKLYKDLCAIGKVDVKRKLAKICVIGNDLNLYDSLLSNIFILLEKNKMRIYTVSVGSCNRNLTLVIDNKDEIKALNILHDKLIS